MKPHTLPVKRRPVPKGILRRLSAVTTRRKQRVAAAASSPVPEMEVEDGGSKISRALTIIFLIHIVAIGLIFFHQRFLDARPAEVAAATKTEVAAPAAQNNHENRPRLAVGEKGYYVKQGDNYSRIAASEDVDEKELRTANQNADIRPGLFLRIPPKVIKAVEPPEVTAIREQTPSDHDRGLVEAVDVSHAPKAQLIRPNVNLDQPRKTTMVTAIKTTTPQANTKTTVSSAPKPSTGGKSYVVQSGDSIWRIASKYKTSQDSIMKANGITDARKVKPGIKLMIP